MNMGEFMQFLTTAKLLDKALTVREARGIFVQVNLDDDLFVQEDSNNSSSVRRSSFFVDGSAVALPGSNTGWMGGRLLHCLQELVLDEFIECLVRVAWEKEPLQSFLEDLAGGEGEDPDFRSEVAGELGEWIVLAVAPFGQPPKKKPGKK